MQLGIFNENLFKSRPYVSKAFLKATMLTRFLEDQIFLEISNPVATFGSLIS